MENIQNPLPIVMSFAGLDPSGGAGMQADIETLRGVGCFCTPIVTVLTAQDTIDVKDVIAVDPMLIIEQARSILEDMPIKVFKIGLLTDVSVIEAIHGILVDYPTIPVVLDPILLAGGGAKLSTLESISAMRELLFPEATIITPNTVEASLLVPNADSVAACASEILLSGCEYVLVTGTHAISRDVVNILFNGRGEVKRYTFERLPHMYHGSGCTLASAIAGYLAHGAPMLDAVEKAQNFTWRSLKHAIRMGHGQWHPNRFFWLK